jgi:hypothetical protein
MRNGEYQYWYNGKKHNLFGYAIRQSTWKGRITKEWWVNGEKIESWMDFPFYIFAIDYELPLDYNLWSKDMKMLFKLAYGGNL